MDFQKDLLAEYDREIAKTQKMLEAIPEDVDFKYKPHPKSMTLGRLSGHLTEMSGEWALNTLTQDKLDLPADHKWESFAPASKAELLAQFNKGLPTVRKELAALPLEKWDEHWQFVFGGHVWIDQPRQEVFRDLVVNHMIHHRAQLGVYLRLLDKPIPGSYGPSADEG